MAPSPARPATGPRRAPGASRPLRGRVQHPPPPPVPAPARHPDTTYQARPKAVVGSWLADPHSRIRTDRIDGSGAVTLRYNGRLHHIGIGRAHARTHVVLLVQDLHIRVVDAATGELLRELVLDPTRNYQPTGKSQAGGGEFASGRGFRCFRCLETSHTAEREGFEPSDPVSQGQLISSESDSAALAPLLAPLAYIWSIFPGWKAGPRPRDGPRLQERSEQRGPGKWQLPCLRRYRPGHREPPPAVQDGRRTQPDRGPAQTA